MRYYYAADISVRVNSSEVIIFEEIISRPGRYERVAPPPRLECVQKMKPPLHSVGQRFSTTRGFTLAKRAQEGGDRAHGRISLAFDNTIIIILIMTIMKPHQ